MDKLWLERPCLRACNVIVTPLAKGYGKSFPTSVSSVENVRERMRQYVPNLIHCRCNLHQVENRSEANVAFKVPVSETSRDVTI